MRRNYVQSESFENNLFQYIFARWDYRSVDGIIARRHANRFRTEIRNIFFERSEKVNFKFDNAKDQIIFQLKRVCVWLVTIVIFGGAVVILYFTNRFTFQVCPFPVQL